MSFQTIDQKTKQIQTAAEEYKYRQGLIHKLGYRNEWLNELKVCCRLERSSEFTRLTHRATMLHVALVSNVDVQDLSEAVYRMGLLRIN